MLSKETRKTNPQKTPPGHVLLQSATSWDNEMAIQVSMPAIAAGRTISSSAV
jgi:hypothetical protein